MPTRSLRVPQLPGPLIAVEEGAFLYWTAGGNVPHQPHLVKVFVPLSDHMVLVLPKEGARIEVEGPVMVDADVHQHVPLAGARVTLFLDPETAGWRARQVMRALGAKWLPVSRELVDPLYRLEAGTAWGHRLLDLLVLMRDRFAAFREEWEIEPPPQAALEIAARIVMTGVADRAGLAKELGMSGPQLTRVFRKTTGLTLRRYAQWAKLTRAIAAASQGVPLVHTTHIAGFSDQAHFTRSARDLLGSVPTGIPFARCVMRGNYFAGLGPSAAGFAESVRP